MALIFCRCSDIARRPLQGAARFLILGLCCLSATVVAQDETFTVRADARVDGVGLSAREAAVRAAERVVIERVLQSMVANGDLRPFRAILDNAPRYVPAYDLLRHDVLDTWTSVEIDAQVAEKPLRSDVAALALPLFPAPPTVLLLVGEQVGDDRIVSVPDNGYAETTLKDRLERMGLKVTGAKSLDPLYTQAALIGLVDGDREAQSSFVEGCLEDVVVVGTAVTTHTPEPGGEVMRNRATLTLSVYRGGEAKLLDAFAISAAVLGTDPNEAGRQAVEDACAKMSGEVAVAAALAMLASQQSNAITVTVLAPESEAVLEDLAAQVLVQSGVDAVRALFITPELGRIRVSGEILLADLARAMEACVLPGHRITVNKAFGAQLEVAVRPDGDTSPAETH